MRGTPPPPGPTPGPGKEYVELTTTDNYRSAICGQSDTSWTGVWGVSSGPTGDGVLGEGVTGVHGRSTAAKGQGVLGEGIIGVRGIGSHTAGEGVLGDGKNGVHGKSASKTDSGVWGENTGGGFGVSGSSPSGVGVFGSGAIAGRFDGDVTVNGLINKVDLIQLATRLQLVEERLTALESSVAPVKQQFANTEPNIDSAAGVSSPWFGDVKVEVNSPGILRGVAPKWRISGGGFPKDETPVRIVIVNETGDYREEISLNAEGGLINAIVAVVKPLPYKSGTRALQQLFCACTDFYPRPSNLTGFRWSETSLVTESDFPG